MAQAASGFTLPQDLQDVMARLYHEGFNLLPLRGKTPAVKGWDKRRLTLAQVLGPMYGGGSSVYGIRLGTAPGIVICAFALFARFRPGAGKQSERGFLLHMLGGYDRANRMPLR